MITTLRPTRTRKASRLPAACSRSRRIALKPPAATVPDYVAKMDAEYARFRANPITLPMMCCHMQAFRDAWEAERGIDLNQIAQTSLQSELEKSQKEEKA